MSSDKRKQGYSLAADVLEEMHQAAKHHEASLSWIAQQAWKIAREEIAKMPPAPSWATKQREQTEASSSQAEPSHASPKPQPIEPQRPPAPPRPEPSQSSPDPKPQRQPARPPEAPLSAWEMERLHGGIHAQSGEPLDHQARELYPWDNDGPTI